MKRVLQHHVPVHGPAIGGNEPMSHGSPAPDGKGAKPLAGFKVLDISNFLAAPMCSMYLADVGAEGLQGERPAHGDEVRSWCENKDGVGLYYKVINRAKRSI